MTCTILYLTIILNDINFKEHFNNRHIGQNNYSRLDVTYFSISETKPFDKHLCSVKINR